MLEQKQTVKGAEPSALRSGVQIAKLLGAAAVDVALAGRCMCI